MYEAAFTVKTFYGFSHFHVFRQVKSLACKGEGLKFIYVI
jgi:hypothetical protein